MNSTEISNSLSTIVGLWPSPAMTDEEARILTFGLSKQDLVDFKRAVQDMMLTPRQFRPSAADVLSMVRFWRGRRADEDARRSMAALGVAPLADATPYLEAARLELQAALKRQDERRALKRAPQLAQ